VLAPRKDSKAKTDTPTSAIRIQWLKDGDHSLKPRKTSGRTQQQNWEAALEELAAFSGTLSHIERG
jgi:predicted alpha/beta-hydrolase family hydrolase